MPATRQNNETCCWFLNRRFCSGIICSLHQQQLQEQLQQQRRPHLAGAANQCVLGQLTCLPLQGHLPRCLLQPASPRVSSLAKITPRSAAYSAQRCAASALAPPPTLPAASAHHKPLAVETCQPAPCTVYVHFTATLVSWQVHTPPLRSCGKALLLTVPLFPSTEGNHDTKHAQFFFAILRMHACIEQNGWVQVCMCAVLKETIQDSACAIQV